MTTPHHFTNVSIDYHDAHTIANALEARAVWMDEGDGAPGPRLAASAYYRELAGRFDAAALALLNTYPVAEVRHRHDERSAAR